MTKPIGYVSYRIFVHTVGINGYSLPRIVGGPPPFELARETSERTGAPAVTLWTYEVPGKGGRGKDVRLGVWRNGSRLTVPEERARLEREADRLFQEGNLGEDEPPDVTP